MKIAPEQLSQIYEKDYFLWLEETIKLLRNRVSAITVTNNRKMELRNPVSRPQDWIKILAPHPKLFTKRFID